MDKNELMARVKALAGRQETVVSSKPVMKLAQNPAWEKVKEIIDDLDSDPMNVINTATSKPKISQSGRLTRYELSRQVNGHEVQLVVYEGDVGIVRAWYVGFNKNIAYMRSLV